MAKVDTTSLTQEDLSLYDVFQPPKPRLREESIPDEEKRSFTSGEEAEV